MSNKVDPNFMRELEPFGLKDASKCYNCGTCTAICDLATPENPFPRKMVRYVQLGQKEKLMKSPEPWLCYYCGDCSSRCPRGAEPGETMMAVRRYLISLYDWTGFARKFYTSETFEIATITIVALLIGLGMVIFRSNTPNMQHPALNSVWPSHSIEKADLLMAAILSFFLLTNVYRCVKMVLGDYFAKIPLGLYLSELKSLIINFLTQKEFGKCKDRKQWFVHLMIMTGYASIFLMVVVLINGLTIESLKFQRDWPEYSIFHPIRLIGYYATFAIMYGTTYALVGRLRKSKPVYKNSHPTDWTFLILLQLTTLTGILVNFTRLLDLAMATYVIYVIHMMIAIPMLVLEVPFAKWAHLAYRPVVLFLLRVRANYIAEQTAMQAAGASRPAL
jgi:ferredoxin/nitrate reductase gamma subunit